MDRKRSSRTYQASFYLQSMACTESHGHQWIISITTTEPPKIEKMQEEVLTKDFESMIF